MGKVEYKCQAKGKLPYEQWMCEVYVDGEKVGELEMDMEKDKANLLLDMKKLEKYR